MDAPAATLALVPRKPIAPHSPIAPPADDFSREERKRRRGKAAIQECGGSGRRWNAALDYTWGKWTGGGGVKVGLLTGILIAVQVLASSQSEAEARHAAPGRPGGPQLLAQRQAPGGHVPVAVEDQHSAVALLASERTAHRHVCSGRSNRGALGLDISRRREEGGSEGGRWGPDRGGSLTLNPTLKNIFHRPDSVSATSPQ